MQNLSSLGNHFNEINKKNNEINKKSKHLKAKIMNSNVLDSKQFLQFEYVDYHKYRMHLILSFFYTLKMQLMCRALEAIMI